MSELISAMSVEMIDHAIAKADKLMAVKNVPASEIWEHMGEFVNKARKAYAKRFVDWFQPRHIEAAKRELAEIVLGELRG